MKIMKIKGIQIEVDISTIFIVLMVGYQITALYQNTTPNEIQIGELIIMGLLGSFMLLISIILHELAHSLTAQKYGLKINKIRLHLFGGVSEMHDEPQSAKIEFLMALAGPLTSLILGGLLILGNYYLSFNSTFLSYFYRYTGYSNIVLGLFNLTPAFPMDGGRVLRSIIWAISNNFTKATKIAANIGNIFSFIFMGLGFIEIFFFGTLGGIWFLIIGGFLRNAVQSSLQQAIIYDKLSEISAKALCSDFQIVIPSNTPISEVIDLYFKKYKKGYFPVGENHNLVGIIHYQDIQNVPDEVHSKVVAKEICKPISEYKQVSEEDSAMDVLKKLMFKEKTPNIVFVEENSGEFCGYIGLDEIKFQLDYEVKHGTQVPEMLEKRET